MELDPFPPLAAMPPGWERRRVLVSRKGDWWTARVPSLPGCVAHGRSRSEATLRIQAAIPAWLRQLEERGDALPADLADAVLTTVFLPAPRSLAANG